MRVVIHSLKDCYYCDKAKDYLDWAGINYIEIKYEKFERERIDQLIAETDCTKFPQIFIDEKFIGGYQELIQIDM